MVPEAMAEVCLQHGYGCPSPVKWPWPGCPKIDGWDKSQAVCSGTFSAGQNYDYWPKWWLYFWSEHWHVTESWSPCADGLLCAYRQSLMRRRESHSSDSQIPIDCVSCELEKIKNKNGVKKILLWFLQCLFSANNTWEAARNNSWGA